MKNFLQRHLTLRQLKKPEACRMDEVLSMTRTDHTHLVRGKTLIIGVISVAGEPLADGVEQIEEEHLLVLYQLHQSDGIFNFLISKVERSSPQEIAPDGQSPSRVVVDQGQGDVVDRGKVEDGGQVEEGDELPDELRRVPELVLCSHLCRGTTTE